VSKKISPTNTTTNDNTKLMSTSRIFFKNAELLSVANFLIPRINLASTKNTGYGIQLYSFRDSMLKNPKKILELLPVKIHFTILKNIRAGFRYGI